MIISNDNRLRIPAAPQPRLFGCRAKARFAARVYAGLQLLREHRLRSPAWVAAQLVSEVADLRMLRDRQPLCSAARSLCTARMQAAMARLQEQVALMQGDDQQAAFMRGQAADHDTRAFRLSWSAGPLT